MRLCRAARLGIPTMVCAALEACPALGGFARLRPAEPVVETLGYSGLATCLLVHPNQATEGRPAELEDVKDTPESVVSQKRQWSPSMV